MFFSAKPFRFHLYSEPADMRKGFDGLSGIVSSCLKQDPLSGDFYVFLNKRRDRIKMLFWDGHGFWIFHKRLEKGTFQHPRLSGHQSVILPYEELVMMLEGIDLSSVKRRIRYNKKTLPS